MLNMLPNQESSNKHIVIIGGGFGGLTVATQLENKKNLSVTLIDRRNHHLFQPLLYQVATAGLNPADIAVPIRAEFSKAKNISVLWGQAKEINLKEKKVYIRDHHGNMTDPLDLELPYDDLIVACGANHSYFGHKNWEEFAPGLKTLEQATEIRRRILSAFEKAENEEDILIQKALLTFVVIGGGPTGVELAGAIADISRTVLVKDFRRIDPTQARVILIEAGDRVLPVFKEKLSEQAKVSLQELGVEVKTKTRVSDVTAEGVQVGEAFIPSRSVVWAAGVEAARLKWTPEIELHRSGCVPVTENLSLKAYPEVHIIGDMAMIECDGKPVPGLAPAAIQEGKYVAQKILKQLKNKKIKPFRYVDKGLMATIGKKRAVVQGPWFGFSGTLAWLVWLFVHVFYLIGFKNRVSVMVQWTWSYVFSKRGARLITDRDWRLKN